MFKDDGTPIKIPKDGFIPAPAKNEIDQALKEFEAQSDSVPVSQSVADSSVKGEELSGMVKFLVKNSGGLVKDKKTAEYILSAFAFVVFAISLFLFLRLL